jgi:hypothetical protein
MQRGPIPKGGGISFLLCRADLNHGLLLMGPISDSFIGYINFKICVKVFCGPHGGNYAAELYHCFTVLRHVTLLAVFHGDYAIALQF